MSTQDIAQGRWQQAKGTIKERWGEITDDEYREAEGNVDKLAGKIQEKYGHAKDEVAEQINQLFDDDNNQTR